MKVSSHNRASEQSGGRSSGLSALTLDEALIADLDTRLSADIQAFQANRCAALVRHAREGSALWAERLPDDPSADWCALPLLDRQQYRSIAESGPLPVPPSHLPVSSSATSGSTGTPVQFHVCTNFRRHMHAQGFSNWRRQGLDLSRSMAMITHAVGKHHGEHITTTPQMFRGGELLKRWSRQFSVEAHARWLSQTEVAYLVTVPSILRGMIDFYEAGAAAPRLDIILTYAESVEPALRSRAAAVLGADIRDCYGCAEIGPLAYQCPSSSERYHVAMANVFIEIADEQDRSCPEGMLGRVIATGLNNFATPAIRYDLGDLAACRWGCPCGFEGQVLEQLLGRARSLVKMPSGERRHPGTFARSWLDVAPIRERRLVQVSQNVIRVEVVLERPITQDERDGIAAMLRREISDELDYEVVQVEAIAWGPSYKRQDFVCMV
jgi:phenylacetate-CoA ligase